MATIDATHRDQIDAAIAEYGKVPLDDLPPHLKNPQNSHDFDLAFAVAACRQEEWGTTVYPVYDDGNFLTGWAGIRLNG